VSIFNGTHKKFNIRHVNGDEEQKKFLNLVWSRMNMANPLEMEGLKFQSGIELTKWPRKSGKKWKSFQTGKLEKMRDKLPIYLPTMTEEECKKHMPTMSLGPYR
jgi:hypothetical protein